MLSDTLLVTGPTNMDLDAYACVIAYGEYLTHQHINHQAAIFGQPQLEVEFMAKLINQPVVQSNLDPSQFSRIALMDMSSLYKADPRIKIEQVVELVDHRKVNGAADFLNAKVIIDLVGAAATIIAEDFRNRDIEPSRNSAALLYAAIVSNTLNFQAGVTTQRDKDAAQWLKQFAKLSDDFAHLFFAAKSDFSGEKLSQQIQKDFSPWPLEGKLIGIIQLEIVGVDRLLKERIHELVSELEVQRTKKHADIAFISICDIDNNRTIFIAPNQDAQNLLAQALGLQFSDSKAAYPQLTLRKEYIPILQKVLTNSRV